MMALSSGSRRRGEVGLFDSEARRVPLFGTKGTRRFEDPTLFIYTYIYIYCFFLEGHTFFE